MSAGQERAAGGDDASQHESFLPRWVLYLALPGLLGPLLVFGFILLTEAAHDVEDCPYVERERRELAPGVIVVEHARRCLPQVEERRFSMSRGGEDRLLGERRFEPMAFEGGYRWSAEISAQGEVQVVVHNPGHDDVLFREGTAEEHEKGISH